MDVMVLCMINEIEKFKFFYYSLLHVPIVIFIFFILFFLEAPFARSIHSHNYVVFVKKVCDFFPPLLLPHSPSSFPFASLPKPL